MKKILFTASLLSLSILGFSQATKTSLGIGFASEGWLPPALPTGVTVESLGNGELYITADSLNQFSPISYTLNNGVEGDEDSVNFSGTNRGYAAVWAKATNPVSIRVDFANAQSPECLCPRDRAANKAGKSTTAVATTLTKYIIGPVVSWEEDYSANTAQNGPVDNRAINQLNIYLNPIQSIGQKNYTGVVTIDSIFVSDSPIIAATNNPNFISNASKLFPNPVSDRANLNYALVEGASVKIVLNDMTGRQVGVIAEGNRNAGINADSFDVSSYEPGIYNVTFIVDGAVAKTERLIVK